MRNEDVIVNTNDLYTIGDNMAYLSNCIDKVATDINSINGQVDGFQDQINDMKNNVSSLETEVRSFMNEMKHNLLVGNAKQSIMLTQMEYDKKYGHRDDVRRRVVGLLQSVDINALKKNTMENIGEETVVNNPDYWLAPALVALCYWYSDNKKMAEKALKKALDRSDEKTSFLFCLIHLRANRKKTAIKWLNRYLSKQDPTNMDCKIILLLDALCSGVFDSEIRDILLKKIDDWRLQLNSYNEYKYLQIERWENYFKGKSPKEIKKTDYIEDFVIESNYVDNTLHYANFNIQMMDEINKVINNNSLNHPNHLEKIDKLVNMLIFDYEEEELKLKSEIRRSNKIINSNGNVDQDNSLENNSFYYSRRDFYTHISNIALNTDDIEVDLNTQKMAIAFSKDYITTAYKNVTNFNMQDDLKDLTIAMKDWAGITKNGSNELELKDDLDKTLEQKYKTEIDKKPLFSKDMIISIIVGALGCILVHKYTILIVLILLVVLTYNVIMLNNNNRYRKMKLSEMKEEKKYKREILINTICEIVDYYFVYVDGKKQHNEFIEYIDSLNYNEYIKTSIENKRRNILIGGK